MSDEATITRCVDEATRRRFESAWRDGTPRPIEDCLPPSESPNYLGTLRELVHIELEFAWRFGCPSMQEGEETDVATPRVEAYLRRFPQLNDKPIILQLLQQEYWVRITYGDCPSPKEYCVRFPEVVKRTQDIVRAARERGEGSTLPEIANYEVLRTLGRGGMGVVYLARHEGLNRLVALKVIAEANAAGEDERLRLRVEAEAAAKLQHPNIVQIFEVGEHNGRPFLCLEYLSGGTLASRLANKPQSARRAAEMLEVLAKAAHHAHQKGVVHRDLKPSNILLSADGTPKISDFGLAKRMDVPAGLTQTGAILGTPSYMPPEQASGQGHKADAAADVYALGAIMYEMVTGRPPFRAETAWATVSLVVSDDPVPPRRLRPDMPRDLETICLKCLSKQPGRRYSSAAALGEDLGRFLENKPVAARPTRSWERALKWARRRPTAAALAAVCMLATIGFLLGLVWHNRQLRMALDETDQQRKRAEANYQMADDAIEAMTRTVENMTQPPIATSRFVRPMARHMLQQLVSFLTDLVARNRGSQTPATRRQVAQALRRMADAYVRLGDNQQALRRYREAIARQEALCAQFPNEHHFRSDLVDSRHNLGELRKEVGNYKEAEGLFRQALSDSVQLLQDVTVKAAVKAAYERQRAKCLLSLGSLLSELNRFSEAEEKLSDAVKTLTALFAVDPKSDWIADHLSSSHHNLGLLYRITDQVSRGKAEVSKAVDLQRARAAGHPSSLLLRHRANHAASTLALCYLDLGEYEKSINAYEEVIKDQRWLADHLPFVPEFHWTLGMSLHNLAIVQDESGDVTSACKNWQRAVQHQRKAVLLGPNTRAYRQNLSNHLRELSIGLRKQGQHRAAVEAAMEFPDERSKAAGEFRFAAGLVAKCLSLVVKDEQLSTEERRATTNEYAKLSVGLLRKAVERGFRDRDDLQDSTDLQSLRAHASFRALLKELK